MIVIFMVIVVLCLHWWRRTMSIIARTDEFLELCKELEQNEGFWCGEKSGSKCFDYWWRRHAFRTKLNYLVKINFQLWLQKWQEQLRHKQKLNIIAFDSFVRIWQPGVVQVSEASLQSAWVWVGELTCHGTTNTLEALQRALKDTETKAVYLLTDGRPDHVRIRLHCCVFSCLLYENAALQYVGNTVTWLVW